MLSLAKSSLAPVLGRHVPVRGPARLLISSYARTRYAPDDCVVTAKTTNGDLFHADLSSALEWQLWAFGGFEPHFAELFSLLARSGDRCVDVGANVGVHTVRLARLVGGDGAVIAVEPSPEVAERLRGNVRLNNLDNVQVVNAAASESPGETRLYRPAVNDTNRARASLLRHAYLTGSTATVQVVTIDELCQYDRVNLIKIDVEGHEAAVVRGAAATIERCAPSVVFEYAPALLDDPADTPFDWLAARGYLMYRIRPARIGLSSRLRLALDPVSQPPAAGGDLLAIAPREAGRLSQVMARDAR